MTAPQRIQRLRQKGWRMPPGVRYVGRPGIFGNPWVVSKTPGDPGGFAFHSGIRLPLPHLSAEEAVVRYRAWLLDAGDAWRQGLPLVAAELERMRRRAAYIRGLARDELRGLDLACYCRPGTPCHADTLLELANQ